MRFAVTARRATDDTFSHRQLTAIRNHRRNAGDGYPKAFGVVRFVGRGIEAVTRPRPETTRSDAWPRPTR